MSHRHCQSQVRGPSLSLTSCISARVDLNLQHMPSSLCCQVHIVSQKVKYLLQDIPRSGNCDDPPAPASCPHLQARLASSNGSPRQACELSTDASCHSICLASCWIHSQATALPADPLTGIPAIQAASKAALTSPSSTVAATATAAASPQKPSELPESAAATAAAQGPGDSKGLGFASHGPGTHTTEDAGCQASGSAAASQQFEHDPAAEGLAYKECCGLAEVIFQRWPAEMHLQSPLHGTTFSMLLGRLGLEGLAFRVLEQLKVKLLYNTHVVQLSRKAGVLS